MLLDRTHPEISPAFDDKEQDHDPCGVWRGGRSVGPGAGVSPLALEIVTGMLRQEAEAPQSRSKQTYLANLVQGDHERNFDVQARDLQECDDLRSDLLKLHLFPDMFNRTALLNATKHFAHSVTSIC